MVCADFGSEDFFVTLIVGVFPDLLLFGVNVFNPLACWGEKSADL